MVDEKRARVYHRALDQCRRAGVLVRGYPGTPDLRTPGSCVCEAGIHLRFEQRNPDPNCGNDDQHRTCEPEPDRLEDNTDDRRTLAFPTGLIRKFDLNSPAGGGFAEIGGGTPVTDSPGSNFNAMTISADGGTLFLAGDERLIILPAP
jgi:hypothetical protein